MEGYCDCHKKHSSEIERVNKDNEILWGEIKTKLPQKIFFWLFGVLVTCLIFVIGLNVTVQGKIYDTVVNIDKRLAVVEKSIEE